MNLPVWLIQLLNTLEMLFDASGIPLLTAQAMASCIVTGIAMGLGLALVIRKDD